MRRLLILFAFLLAFQPGAWAHPLLQDSMWVVFAPDRIRVAVNVSYREILVAQMGKGHGQDVELTDATKALAEKHRDYVLSHLHLSVDGAPLAGQITSVTPPPIYGGSAEDTMFQYELEYPLDLAGKHVGQVRFSHDVLREYSYAPGQPWDVTYVVRLKRSDLGDVSTGLLRANAPQEFATGWGDPDTMNAKEPASTFGGYLRLGVMHILEGWDHLLFVGALVLAALSFWEMFKVIGCFTLAHTLTLALSTLTGLKLPGFIVEPIIAGSIVFIAVENIIWPQRSRGWTRLAIAFAFGLVHGLGFAGGLRDSMEDLGMRALVNSLVAFSAGVEIGHFIVVIPAFTLLKLGDWQFQTPFRPAALRYGSIVISCAGIYYFINAVSSI